MVFPGETHETRICEPDCGVAVTPVGGLFIVRKLFTVDGEDVPDCEPVPQLLEILVYCSIPAVNPVRSYLFVELFVLEVTVVQVELLIDFSTLKPAEALPEGFVHPTLADELVTRDIERFVGATCCV